MATAFAGPLSSFYAAAGGDRDKLVVGVEAWRDDLRSALAEGVASELEWDERASVAAERDLGESGWMGLRLFAFYAERADLEMPDTVPALLELDRDWRVAHDAKFARSLYGQLLACRVWLPGDFPVTMRAPLPDGDSAEVGSLDVLVDQLRWLNRRTFAVDEDEFAGWQALPAPAGSDLLDGARRGFGALWSAAAVAREGRVPLVVSET